MVYLCGGKLVAYGDILMAWLFTAEVVDRYPGLRVCNCGSVPASQYACLVIP